MFFIALLVMLFSSLFLKAQCPGSPLTVSHNSNAKIDACVGYNPSAINLTVSGGNENYTYQWYVNGNPIRDSTRSSLDLPQFLTPGSYSYYVIVSDDCNPVNSATSSSALKQFNIIAEPSVAISGVLTGCQGSSLLLTANPSNVIINNIYYWQSSPTGTVGSYTDISSQNSSTFSPPTIAPNIYYYGIRVTGGAACSERRAQATLTVNPLPTAPTSVTALPSTICSGASSNLNSTSSDNTIRWYIVETGGTNIGTSASGANFSVSPTSTTTYYAESFSSSSCASATRTAVTVMVNPKPVGSTSAQTVCSGSATSVALSSTPIGSTFSWTAVIQTSPSSGTISGHSSGSGTPIAQTLTNTGTTAGVIRYTVTPTLNGCAGTSFMVDVMVNPSIRNNTISLQGQIPCGSSPTINFSGSTPPTLSGGVGTYTYAWASSTNGNCCWSIILGQTGPSLAIIQTAQTIFYKRYVYSGGCVDSTEDKKVNQNQVPTTTGFLVTGGGSYCTGGAGVSVGLNGSALGINFQLRQNETNIGTAVAGTGFPLNFGLQTAGIYTVMATNPDAPQCSTPVSNSVTVIVNPLPTITLGTPASVCFNTSAQTTPLTYSAVTNAPTTYSITWNAAAITAGFINVTDAPLPASPIQISVPANVATGTYTGTITVKNANGCISAGKTFTITINPKPAPIIIYHN